MKNKLQEDTIEFLKREIFNSRLKLLKIRADIKLCEKIEKNTIQGIKSLETRLNYELNKE